MSENFLKKAREEKMFTQASLARKAGLSKQLIWGFENGRSGVSNSVLVKISEALGVTPSYIMTGQFNGEYFDEKGKKRMMEAIKIARDFYKDYDFDEKTILRVAADVYALMVDFERSMKKINKNDFKKSLNDKIIAGMAAKCFADSRSKT